MAAILVIDEYEGFREAMSYCLPKFGHLALVAANAAAGVKIAETRRVDVVLLDLGSRRQTGFEGCGTFKRHGQLKAIPLVMMGDTITPQLAVRARAAGADAIVAKPIEWPEFLELVDRLIHPPAGGGGESPRGSSPDG